MPNSPFQKSRTRLNSCKLSRSRLQKGLTFVDAQFCQFGVPARKESFASKIWMSQFKQITLVKKAELQLTSIDELTNRCAFERCDPIDPFEVAALCAYDDETPGLVEIRL